MTLDKALHILARTYTTGDERTGFTIWHGVGPYSAANSHSPGDIVEAWKVLRAHLGLQTEPS